MKYLYIYILLIFVMLLFAYYNSIQAKENITTHIRRFYRPYVRHARIFTESFHNHIYGHINRLIRKTGLFK
jgi:hypothetical protein